VKLVAVIGGGYQLLASRKPTYVHFVSNWTHRKHTFSRNGVSSVEFLDRTNFARFAAAYMCLLIRQKKVEVAYGSL
jgi:hypothetical protein